jgi:hypothetical protein
MTSSKNGGIDPRYEHLEHNLSGIVAAEFGAFLELEIPPRTCLMSPWLPSGGLAQVYAYRGVGKTFFALNVGYAVATGGEYLGWRCPTPKRVLYIDGEMPAADMQERLRMIKGDEPMTTDKFKIITPDFQNIITPNLATEEGQSYLESYTSEADLIIVDSVAILCRTGKENNSDEWTPVQQWLLKMRSEGRSVLLVHHAGKNGGQRGTSAREDVLDTVIKLKKPTGSSPTEGANFEVHFEKNRGFTGTDAQPFNTSLSIENGRQIWSRQSLVDTAFNRCVALANDGLNGTEIAHELDIHKGTVSKHLKKAKTEGLIKAIGND